MPRGTKAHPENRTEAEHIEDSYEEELVSHIKNRTLPGTVNKKRRAKERLRLEGRECSSSKRWQKPTEKTQRTTKKHEKSADESTRIVARVLDLMPTKTVSKGDASFRGQESAKEKHRRRALKEPKSRCPASTSARRLCRNSLREHS